MLYISTRNNQNVCTYMHAMKEERCNDDGLFLPFKAPFYTEEYLRSLSGMSFGHRVAEVLNCLFHSNLTAWDVEFCIGRYPVRFQSLSHRIILAETWHNLERNYGYLLKKLHRKLCPEGDVTNWCEIGIRIALLVAIWTELLNQGIETADISVVAGDFSLPMSAWYARKWGLPIRNIVCCCNENNNLWNLIYHGQFRTDMIGEPTQIPDSEMTLPENLERLVYACGGAEEVQHYLENSRRGLVYYPSEQAAEKMRKGLFVSVVGSKRVGRTIPNVYSTHQYLMAPGTALAYAGLQDYRAKQSETGYAVIIADESPVFRAGVVADTLGITIEELKSKF